MNASITGSIVLVSAFVPLKGGHHQREAVLAGEQSDGDLRLQAAFLRVPRLAEPITFVGLEVQGGHVEEHQARRSQPGVCGAGHRNPPPPGILRIHRQAPLHGPVRRRRDPGLLQHPQRIQPANRLDDPGHHQVPEHLIAAGRLVKTEDLPGMLQRIEQAIHPRCRDRQRPAASPFPGRLGRLRAQV
jgi:hypothetical protein